MKRAFYLETFLISLAVLVLEVSYTRVFSFKLVYYFTYVIIGIALLGLGAGGVLVSASERLRRTPPHTLVLACCVVAGTGVLAGYLVIALTPLQLFKMVMSGLDRPGLLASESAKLLGVLLSLFVPFLYGGVALATIFSRGADRIGRLYAADLFGAALGCVLVIPAMTVLSPPGAVYAAGAAFALAGVRLAGDAGGSARAAVLGLGVLLVAGAIGAPLLPDPVRDPVKGTETELIYSAWSPVFRVDVAPVGGPSRRSASSSTTGRWARRSPSSTETSDRWGATTTATAPCRSASSRRTPGSRSSERRAATRSWRRFVSAPSTSPASS